MMLQALTARESTAACHGEAAMAKTALGQIEAACEAMRTAGHGPLAAYYEARPPEARAIFDRLQAL